MARRLLLLSIVCTALVHRAAAQVRDSTPRAVGATVRGVVRDSIARAPLAGAWVQLVSHEAAAAPSRTVIADSLGQFAFDDVAIGRYALGFFHPLLDSLGVEAPVREIQISRQRTLRADLAIPSADRMRAAICGVPRQKGASGGAVVIGTVRGAADRAPVEGATVTVEWLELTFERGLVSSRRPRVTVTTGANGWFALCDVPSAGSMLLGARSGADSSDVFETDMPAVGFMRQDVYLGRSRTVLPADSLSRADTMAHAPRRLRLGEGRLNGTVTAADGGRPLAGALVRIVDGPVARVNERGEWTLANSPTGTRLLEVRAVGYYAVRRPVDVIAHAGPVRVTLSTFRAMLDTVKVTAFRVADRHQSGFTDRRRSSAGRYITEQEIERRAPLTVSDLLRSVPGLRLGYAADTVFNEANITTDLVIDSTATLNAGALSLERLILMRRGAGEWCSPDFFIDGQQFRALSADNLDSFLQPRNIAAVEVYTEATVPIQFSGWRTACGSIVIWTK